MKLLTLICLLSMCMLTHAENKIQRINQDLHFGTIISDAGFEGGTPNTSWNESSTNFGTPICNVPDCGRLPNSGDYWAWFGGIANDEEALLSQMISIPNASSATLSFAFSVPDCVGTGTFEVLIDSTQVFTDNNNSSLCDIDTYTTINVDLTSYQGQTVNLQLHGITGGGFITSFMVDDLAITFENSTYTIGGTLTGILPGNEVTLQNNLGDNILLNNDGPYVFTTPLSTGEGYDVTVLGHPVSPSQTCTVSNHDGTMANSNISNINISCDNLDLLFTNGFEL